MVADDSAGAWATDLGALFGPCWAAGASAGAVLAVSGGSDSTALMVLFARWLAQRQAPLSSFCVATVDHGLRPQSAAEAQSVMQAAQALGFPAVTLHWTGSKPATGLAEAAREARYRLLADLMRARRQRFLLTAHTADDQAETLLMRLARGSGVDGLAGIAPLRPLLPCRDPADSAPPLMLARPLLDVAKSDLQDLLRRQAIAWVEDPTNADPTHERPRLREARAVLDRLGLTPLSLGTSARRLRRAREALEHVALSMFTRADPVARVDPLGYVAIDLGRLLAEPEEIAVRVLRLAVAAAGGSARTASLASVEAVLDRVRTDRCAGCTLGGAALRRVGGERLLVEREPGRTPAPDVALRAGTSQLWDGRFWVQVGEVAPQIRLGPLGAEGVRWLTERGRRPHGVPARTLRALPALRHEGVLLGVPSVSGTLEAPLQLTVTVRFQGIKTPALPEAGD